MCAARAALSVLSMKLGYARKKFLSRKNVPLISIIIPTFNSMSGNKRIGRLLSSIFNQTYDNFEVIVVDNFSEDKTKEVCTEFPIIFIQEKSTISKANNIGLEIARGKYIIFLDSDMELPASFLEECARIIESKHVDCIQMQFTCVESRKPSFLNCVKLRNLELELGAAPLNIYCYSAQIIGDRKFPESENPIVGEEYIFRNRILRKRLKVGLAKTRILHYYDPSVTWLIRRSLKYGKWFVETQKHLTLSEELRFIRYNSVVKKHSIRALKRVIKSKPSLLFPFMLYIYIKYLSFILGYLSKKVFT